MTLEYFKRANPLGPWLESKGVELKRGTTNRCPIQDHKPGHLCVTVNVVKEVWNCNDHGQGGDIVRWMALEQCKPDADVIKAICGNGNGSAVKLPKPTPRAEPTSSDIKKIYSYQDANGTEAYQVLRIEKQGEKKTFRQRHNGPDGGWQWSMDGVTRLLYQLPKIMAAQQVIVCEGEKDAETVTALGFVGTTNVGGATNWLDSYAETLAGKDVVLCGDNDAKGLEHVEIVLASIAKKAKSVRRVKVPAQFKDVTEWLGEQPTPENTAKLTALIDSTPALIQGIHIPIQTMPECELKYVRQLQDAKNYEFSFGWWLSGLSACRMLVGELATLIASTGVGKTYGLCNIALAAKSMPVLFFEMELTEEAIYQRIMSIHMQWGEYEVRKAYSEGEILGGTGLAALSHIHVCCESSLTVESIERHINNAELKIGKRPKVVLLDYIQLIQGPNKSRFDNISDAAEQMKVIAKTTRTIIIMASQMSRKPNDQKEVFLHDAKQSGSIENSSGLVIGMWKDDPDNKNKIKMRVLKNTKGESGKLIECQYKPGLHNAFTGKIVEESPISQMDIPATRWSVINDD